MELIFGGFMKYSHCLKYIWPVILLIALSALPAFGATYQIDGNINNWVVNLQDGLKGVGHESSWLPKYDTVDFAVADKIDPNLANDIAYPDWTGYNSLGVHIQGTGYSKTYTAYPDPVLPYTDDWAKAHNGHYIPPSGGALYDIKAIYFDDDINNVYFAIVTNLPATGADNGEWYMGDISFKINNKNYGIEIPHTWGASTGKVVINPTWVSNLPQYFSISSPCTFDKTKGQTTGNDNIFYNQHTGVIDTATYKPNFNPYGVTQTPSYPVYIIEIGVPRSAIGNPNAGDIASAHMTIGCGNDVINLNPITVKTAVPEFPTVVLPVAAIMGIFLIYGRKNN